MDTSTIKTMLRQVGNMNVLAISGGRVEPLDENTVRLPIRYGYAVEIEYLPSRDWYLVRRTFTRSGRRTVKATETGLYADQVGDGAYRASCYRDDTFGR